MPVASFNQHRDRIPWRSIGVIVLCSGVANAQPTEPNTTVSQSANSTQSDDLRPHVKRYPNGDGVYGRFAGDLDLSPKLGASYDGNWNASFGASAWYFWTAGLSFVQSESLRHRNGYPKGQSAISVEIRPLFIPRWSRDWERGPAWWDLVVDSLAVGVGVYFNYGGKAVERRGLQASVGVGAPLLADARGPWIELSGIHRFADSAGSADNALLMALSWHWLVNTGLHDK